MSGVLHENLIDNDRKNTQKFKVPKVLEKFFYYKEAVSTLGIKYPSLRDHPMKTGETWLEGKRLDDGAEGLWRIYDSLYDFSDFIYCHPGGSDWLKLTQVLFICFCKSTVYFQSAHIIVV